MAMHVLLVLLAMWPLVFQNSKTDLQT